MMHMDLHIIVFSKLVKVGAKLYVIRSDKASDCVRLFFIGQVLPLRVRFFSHRWLAVRLQLVLVAHHVPVVGVGVCVNFRLLLHPFGPSNSICGGHGIGPRASLEDALLGGEP